MCLYRQKLSGAREEVIEEQQAQVLEDVPMRSVHSITVLPRNAQPFKYATVASTVGSVGAQSIDIYGL